jgi:hypothetical protein
VLTNKIKYSKICPHCRVSGLSISIRKQQIKETRQVQRELAEQTRLDDKVRMEIDRTIVFRKSGV